MHRRAFDLFSVKHEDGTPRLAWAAACWHFRQSSFSLVAMPTAALAQTKTWTGANGISWNNTFNWSPNGVPTASSNIVFPTGVFITTPLLTANGTAGSIPFDAGATNYSLERGRQPLRRERDHRLVHHHRHADDQPGQHRHRQPAVPDRPELTITNNAAATPRCPDARHRSEHRHRHAGQRRRGRQRHRNDEDQRVVCQHRAPNNQVDRRDHQDRPGRAECCSGTVSNLAGGVTLNGGTLRLDYSTNTAPKFTGLSLTSAGGDLVVVPHASTVVDPERGRHEPDGRAHASHLPRAGGRHRPGSSPLRRSAGATLDLPGFGSVQRHHHHGNTNVLLGTGPAFATIDGSAGPRRAAASSFRHWPATDTFSAGTNTVLTAINPRAHSRPTRSAFQQ